MSIKPILAKVIWLTGYSGAGKTTTARNLKTALTRRGVTSCLLDADYIRRGLCSDLGFDAGSRIENVRRVGQVAKLISDEGIVAIVAVIAPFEAEREQVRSMFPLGQYFEVFVDCPLKVCQERDTKGLYARAGEGRLQNLTGVDSPYQRPKYPDLILDTATKTPEATGEELLEFLDTSG